MAQANEKRQSAEKNESNGGGACEMKR